jgi:ribonuclease HIII
MDEAGKGDYFGPLVTCAVFLAAKHEGWLETLGVADSKSLNDAKIKKLAPLLKKTLPYEVILLRPEKYNSLYEKMKNLNHLMGWAHARGLLNLAEKQEITLAILDQFSKGNEVQQRLGETKIELHSFTKAESDLAVAAASIIARDTFLWEIKKQEKAWQRTFPLGASTIVEGSARGFLQEFGEKKLFEVAKIHFKTTEKIRETNNS